MIFTAEEHNIIGGLGSATAEVLSECYPSKLKRIGINDVFGESGNADDLIRKYELDAEMIAKRILEWVE